MIPRTIAPIGPTKPAAGVTATKPAIAPETTPSMEGFLLSTHSANIQASAAAAVATIVFSSAKTAIPVASSFMSILICA